MLAAITYALAAVTISLILLCVPVLRRRAGWLTVPLGLLWPLLLLVAAIILCQEIIADHAEPEANMPP